MLGDKGVKSEAYLALNPQGKMPLLVLPDGFALPESQVRAEKGGHTHAAGLPRDSPPYKRDAPQRLPARHRNRRAPAPHPLLLPSR